MNPPRPLRISAQFATSLESPSHIAAAEKLGYARAWLFDTPHESPDVWMMLALAAQRTSTIALGPGVLVPKLRHPMVNAAAAEALWALAPGRVSVAFGTGFAGARALGGGPSSWASLAQYVRAFRGLLDGETVEWNGARMRMMPPPRPAPPRTTRIPVLISAIGPKGLAVAGELADGLITLGGLTGAARDFDWTAIAVHGTVLTDGESLRSPRVRSAAGPGHALAYHTTHEFGGDVTALPAGQVWLDEIEKTPSADRHFAIYDQHLIGLNAADAVAWDAGSWAAVPQTTITGSPTEVAERLVQYHRDGVDDVIYQPAGEDIVGELTTFMAAARIAVDRTQPDRIPS